MTKNLRNIPRTRSTKVLTNLNGRQLRHVLIKKPPSVRESRLLSASVSKGSVRPSCKKRESSAKRLMPPSKLLEKKGWRKNKLRGKKDSAKRKKPDLLVKKKIKTSRKKMVRLKTRMPTRTKRRRMMLRNRLKVLITLRLPLLLRLPKVPLMIKTNRLMTQKK